MATRSVGTAGDANGEIGRGQGRHLVMSVVDGVVVAVCRPNRPAVPVENVHGNVDHGTSFRDAIHIVVAPLGDLEPPNGIDDDGATGSRGGSSGSRGDGTRLRLLGGGGGGGKGHGRRSCRRCGGGVLEVGGGVSRMRSGGRGRWRDSCRRTNHHWMAIARHILITHLRHGLLDGRDGLLRCWFGDVDDDDRGAYGGHNAKEI
jgi:hypothetical protein